MAAISPWACGYFLRVAFPARGPVYSAPISPVPIVHLRVATSDTWRDKNTGERKERTEWHRVVIFNERLVDVVERYVKKGSKLYVEGALQTRKWTDNTGAEKYTTEVVLQRFRGELTMLDGRGGGGGGIGGSAPDDMGSGGPSSGGGMGGSRSSGGSAGDLDDEIPF